MNDPAIYISIATALFSLWVYFRHDAQLKKQEGKIKAYELENWAHEKELEKKANLAAHIEIHPQGRRDVVVINNGKSIATNCSVRILETEGFILNEELTSFTLHPNQRLAFSVFIYIGSPDFMTVELKWKDNFSSENNITYQLQAT